MTELRYIDLSASQLETFLDCPRKWAFGKIDGLYLPSSPAAEFGGTVHKVRERYLIEGVPIDIRTREGQVAICGIKDIPLPKTQGLEVEAEFDFFLSKVLHFRGRIDYQHLIIRPPVIGDHKTTSDLKWAKSSDDLLVDIQAGIYSYNAFLKTGAEKVELRWHYMTTSSQPQARTVRATIYPEQVATTMERCAEVGLQIFQVRKKHTRALDVEFNASACGKYGGCPFIGHCNLTDGEKAQSVFGSFRDIALAEQGILHQKRGPVPISTFDDNSPIPNQTTKEITMAEDAGNSLLARLNARKNLDAKAVPAAAPVAAPPPAPAPAPAAPSPAAPSPAPAGANGPAAPVQSVNPPERPPAPPSPVWSKIKNAWVPPTLNTDKGVWEFPPDVVAEIMAAGNPPESKYQEGGAEDLLGKAKRVKKPAAAKTAEAAPAAAPPPAAPTPAAVPSTTTSDAVDYSLLAKAIVNEFLGRLK